MNRKKNIVVFTSLLVAVSFLWMSYALETYFLAVPFHLLGMMCSGVFLSEDKHLKIGWVLLVFVMLTTIIRVLT
jgi:hypothetical protein